MDTRLTRSVTVPYRAEQMFDLVDRIERYPEFLPWCSGVSVDRDADGETVRASMEVSFGPFRRTFATANRHVRPGRIEVELDRGPLDDLRGAWTFDDLGDGSCRVGIDITFRFDRVPLQRVASKVFIAIYGRMLHAFSRRARQVYGQGSAEGHGRVRQA